VTRELLIALRSTQRFIQPSEFIMSQPYVAQYPKGRRVRIAAREQLERFRTEWQLHHPLTSEQLDWAGDEVEVIEVAFYHGGDQLYVVRGTRGESGYWHETCLTNITERAI
jgi:hypothetical protein